MGQPTQLEVELAPTARVEVKRGQGIHEDTAEALTEGLYLPNGQAIGGLPPEQ